MVNRTNRLLIFLVVWVVMGFLPVYRAAASNNTGVVRILPTPPADAKPLEKTSNSAFKGIWVGMNADEVRKKLGDPKEKGDTQDFYVFSGDVSGQVYYDGQHAVSAVSLDFTGKTGAPTPKDVLGDDVAAGADGAIYKMVRFPKDGYWVSYNRTAGADPMVSITMQKIP